VILPQLNVLRTNCRESMNPINHPSPGKPVARRPALWISMILFVLGTLLSASLARTHYRIVSQEQTRYVEGSAERIIAGLAQQFELGGALARAFQALFLASDEVSEAEFAQAYHAIHPEQVFPAMVAVAYARREATASGERYLTRYIEPRAGNEALVGLDVASQPANLRALLDARDHDEPVLSAPFTLVQLAETGVVVRVPAYAAGELPQTEAQRRQRDIGSLAMSVRMSRLIDRVLADAHDPDLKVWIDDVSDGNTQAIIVPAQASAAVGPTMVQELRYGGRVWRVRVAAGSEWPSRSFWPWLTLAVGLLATTMLTLLIWVTLNTRYRAESLAHGLSRQSRESEYRFRALNELLPALVALIRAADGSIVYFNRAARSLLGVETIGAYQLDTIVADTRVRASLVRVAGGGSPIVNEIVQLHGVSGRRIWVTLSVSLIDLDQQPHLLAVANDITELRELNDRLSYQASHDELTDLYNRREFERRLALAITQVDRGGPPAALMYADLDQFKLINDTSGHAAGDRLLADLATVLRAQIRPNDVLARLGGDEFGLLMVNATPDDARDSAERLRRSIDGFVFTIDDKSFTITSSIGVVMIERPVRSLRELLACADTACYMAKERGRNRVHLHSDIDTETAQRRSEMQWVGRLRRALRDNRFRLHYQILQPAGASPHAEGVHFELLLRLLDDDGSLVQPGAFIPSAERFGVMPLIDRWVVEQAITHFEHVLPDSGSIGLCAINLSGQTVDDESFADFVIELLRVHSVPASKLCFEITETAAISNLPRVVRFMEKLRAIGCRFALDDFGAGMASFGYLKNLPVDVLKIDGSFIQSLETDRVSQRIVRAVTEIGHELGLVVIAEWVSDARLEHVLQDIGVDYLQGYAVHRPEPVAWSSTG